MGGSISSTWTSRGMKWTSHDVPHADGTDECRDADTIDIKDVGWFSEEPGTLYYPKRGKVTEWDKGGLPLTREWTAKVNTGWSSSYYELPENAEELQDLIEFKNMNFALGNIFKACYRMGDKAGTSEVYDLNKIIFYAERELRRIENEDRPGNSTS
jgi:hypothetical protein